MTMNEPQTASELMAHYAALKRRNLERDRKLVMVTAPLPDRAMEEAHVEIERVETCRHLMSDIVAAVSKVTAVSIAEMLGGMRNRIVVDARHVAVWLSVALTKKSHTAVGQYFGMLDHSSINNALNKIDNRRSEFNGVISDVCKLLGATPPAVAYVQKYVRTTSTWTDEELAALIDYKARKVSMKVIAQEMERTEKSLKNKWYFMERKKHAARQ